MPRTIPEEFWKPRKKLFVMLVIFALCFACCAVHDSAVKYSEWYSSSVDNHGQIYIATSRNIMVYSGGELVDRISLPRRQMYAYNVIIDSLDEMQIITSDNEVLLYDKCGNEFTKVEAVGQRSRIEKGGTSNNGLYSVMMYSTFGCPWIEYTDGNGMKQVILFPIADYLFHLGTILFGVLFAVCGIKLLIDARVLYREQIRLIGLRIKGKQT